MGKIKKQYKELDFKIFDSLEFIYPGKNFGLWENLCKGKQCKETVNLMSQTLNEGKYE